MPAWTSAGAQTVPRPSSYRWANGSVVTAATSIAASPTSNPEVTITGMCVAAISGIVRPTAAPNDRPVRSLRNA